ncbi:histone deacetylase HDT1 [Tanacetum coccineum]
MTTGELVNVDMSGHKFFRHDGDKYLRVKDIHGVVSKVRGQNMKGTDGKRSSRGAHCRTCNRNFKTEGGLQDHNQANHASE